VADPGGLGPDRVGRVPGGVAWFAFAWSPLVSVYPEGGAAPDLARMDLRFGLPHPRLSNNGVYAVVLFDATDPAAGGRALNQTVVQPTNAHTNISGVADGSFDATLGYEAVALYFQGRGARIGFGLPVVGGEPVTTPVLFVAGLLERHPHEGAEQLLQYLLDEEVQRRLHLHHMRPVLDGMPQPAGGLSLEGARVVDFDWARWRELEARLEAYEVEP
jgi:ABC-type molybdate transport system substrate-binding protein